MLAATVLAPAAAWGHIINGRSPSQRERTEFLTKFSNAVYGTEIVGIPSTQLKQVLVLGHCSDLLFYMTQKIATALHKWKASHAVPLRSESPVLAALRRALKVLQCENIRPGVFSHGHGEWNCSSPLGFLPKLQHNFRQHWRTTLFNTWLSSSRRDASRARSVNLLVNDKLIDKLRAQVRGLNGWESTIMCGGMWSEAHVPISERPKICPQCNEQVVPSVDHIFWECPMWNCPRLLPRPRNELTSRLGWNQNGVCFPILKQCGDIRREHVKLRRSKRSARGGVCCLLRRSDPLLLLPLRCYRKSRCSADEIVAEMTFARTLLSVPNDSGTCLSFL